MSTRRPQYFYNEKQLRDEAAAEVALQQGINNEDSSQAPASKKRKHLNPDEKLEQSRNRNREHAKNTRLRKKAYVIKLQALVDKMRNQKDSETSERRALGKRIYDMQLARKSALGVFLTYRGCNLRSYDKWAEILDDKFILKMPITPYRSFYKGDIVNNVRIVCGIEGAIAESASIFVMAQAIGYGNPKWVTAMKNCSGCYITHEFGPDDMLASGDQVICRFRMKVEGGDMVGIKHNCVQNGMIKARFGENNKIVSAEMVFDVMGFMQQLQKASSISPESNIVPNTLDMALHASKEARVIMLAEPPYRVLTVNDAWTRQNNITQSQIEGKSFCQELGTSLSQRETLIQLAADCAACRPGSAVVMAQTAGHGNSKSLLLYVRFMPISGDSSSSASPITHILAIQTELPLLQSESDAVTKYLEGEAQMT